MFVYSSTVFEANIIENCFPDMFFQCSPKVSYMELKADNLKKNY